MQPCGATQLEGLGDADAVRMVFVPPSLIDEPPHHALLGPPQRRPGIVLAVQGVA